VEFVGPLPAEIQSYPVFAAGVASTSQVRDPALDLLRLMAGPRATRALRAQGMEPG
jgi:hypothetical protein